MDSVEGMGIFFFFFYLFYLVSVGETLGGSAYGGFYDLR